MARRSGGGRCRTADNYIINLSQERLGFALTSHTTTPSVIHTTSKQMSLARAALLKPTKVVVSATVARRFASSSSHDDHHDHYEDNTVYPAECTTFTYAPRPVAQYSIPLLIFQPSQTRPGEIGSSRGLRLLHFTSSRPHPEKRPTSPAGSLITR